MISQPTDGRRRVKQQLKAQMLVPPVDDTLDAARLWSIKEYSQRLQATIAAQETCRPIYELCTGAYQIPGSSQIMMLWDLNVVSEES